MTAEGEGHRVKIGVLGPHDIDRHGRELGREVGAEIARSGAILLCAEEQRVCPYRSRSNGSATHFGVRCLGPALTAAARCGVWDKCE